MDFQSNRRRAWRKALKEGPAAVRAYLDALTENEYEWIRTGHSDGNYTRGLIAEAMQSADSCMRAVLLECSGHLPPADLFSLNDRYGVYWEAGETVRFGIWPQGANGEAAPIEWRILKSAGDTRLLISRCAIDCMPYHSCFTGIDWANSSLRAELNGRFFKTAFTPEEQNQILESALENSDNPDFGTPGGENTADRVFLLSLAQAADPELFADDAERVCSAAPYAIARGGKSYRGACWWWLRTPGSDPYYAAHVDYSGTCYSGGGSAFHAPDCVRPAIRIRFTP